MIPIVIGRGIKTGSLAVSLDIKSSLSPVCVETVSLEKFPARL